MEIGSIIHRRRMELGLTLEQVGSYVGVGKSTVKKWETGSIKNLKRDKIELLAKVLGLSPSTFITGEIRYSDPETQALYEKEELAFRWFCEAYRGASPPAIEALTEKEQRLIAGFRKLNDLGQEAVLITLEGFTRSDAYKKCHFTPPVEEEE